MKNIIIRLVIFAIFILASFGFNYLQNDTMITKNTYEGNGFTFDLPSGFEVNEITNYDFSYSNKDETTYVEYSYIDSHLATSIKTFGLVRNDFITVGEGINSYTKVDINGIPAYQTEYKILSDSLIDNVECYYTGYMTYIKMDGGFLIFDTYDAIIESDSSYKEASDSKLALLQDIVMSINMSYTSAYIPSSHPAYISSTTSLSSRLPNDWQLDYDVVDDSVQIQNFSNPKLSLFLDTRLGENEIMFTMEEIKEYLDSSVTSGYIDSYYKTTILGEDGYIYSYSEIDEDIKYYGVTSISPHFSNDIYYASYSEDIDLTEDEIDALCKIVSDGKMPRRK